jgi:hypothetical protein
MLLCFVEAGLQVSVVWFCHEMDICTYEILSDGSTCDLTQAFVVYLDTPGLLTVMNTISVYQTPFGDIFIFAFYRIRGS